MTNDPAFTKVFFQCLKHSIRVGLLISMAMSSMILLLGSCAQAEELQDAWDSNRQTVTHPGKVKKGSLLFRDGEHFSQAPLLHTDVQAKVSGMIARTRVRQRFTNTEQVFKEGIYVFPLPETAAVDHLRMHIGERVIEGQIKEKQKAKKQYQAARKAGKKASLVEQERANVFTTSLANIGPGESITVEIEYQQSIPYESGTFSWRFPMVVAPRYIPGNTIVKGFSGSGWAHNTNEVVDAARITPPVIAPGEAGSNPVSISLELDAGFEVESIDSLYHAVDVQARDQAGQYLLGLKAGSIPADRDFVVNWKARPEARPRAALFRETLNGHDYALIMVVPPEHRQDLILKREIIFVIDTSGSMAGTSIRQAKAALELAVSRLRAGDRFNIIQFNSYTTQLFPFSRPVDAHSIEQARQYIASLHANGGTEMSAAIRAALLNQANALDLRQVVFLTDGSVGNEDALFAQINKLLGASRLFTIGIGSAPNSHFMNRAAQVGRGTHTYIGDIAEVQTRMDALFSKLENPVLSDIVLDSSSLQDSETWPTQIPDLYLGEPLLLSIRAKELKGRIRIKGQLTDSTWQTELSFKGGQQRAGVSGLWARRKIASLMSVRARENEKPGIRQQIVETALEHHLVSKYTSLLAVDVTPSRAQHQPLQKHNIAVNLPGGWQYDKVFAGMPQTASPASLYLLFGVLLLVLNAGMRWRFKHV